MLSKIKTQVGFSRESITGQGIALFAHRAHGLLLLHGTLSALDVSKDVVPL